MVRFTIDGQPFEAEDNQTILEVARRGGVKIPTLCYHPALEPYGACRLCTVEVRWGRLRLTTLAVELSEGSTPGRATVRLGDRRLEADAKQEGRRLTLTLAEPVVVGEGEAIEVEMAG